jgi:hypothetical protein
LPWFLLILSSPVLLDLVLLAMARSPASSAEFPPLVPMA